MNHRSWRRTGCKRLKILIRDHQCCRYCGRELNPFASENDPDFLTIDHVKPLREGGSSRQENMVVACRPCQQNKGGYSLWRAKMRLLPVPGLEAQGAA